MSELSARVSSRIGDGGLFGRGGETLTRGAPAFLAFVFTFDLRKMGASFWTSASGTSDREDESESSMAVVLIVVERFRDPKPKQEVKVEHGTHVTISGRGDT